MICAIVLAAGQSHRMGTQKLLLPFGATTVIAHIADELLRSIIDKVYVVVGYERNRIIKELSGRPISIVTNPDYTADMLSSVRCGLKALPKKCEAVLVTLGDQPSVTSELVDEMVQSFTRTNKGILVPLYRGKHGHPILFSELYYHEILTRYDNVGLRGLLHAHPEDIFELNVSTSAVLLDMDSPEDYQRQLTSLKDNTEKRHNSQGE